MTLTTLRWLCWGGLALLIAYDIVVGLPSRVFMSLLIAAILLAVRDLNKRLEVLELGLKSDRFDALTKRFDELNKRLRWLEYKFFGADRDDMLSEEWSERNHASEYEP